LPALILVSDSGDNGFPDSIVWLLLTVALLAISAGTLPIEWGHRLHLMDDPAFPGSASQAQLRVRRRWRRSATIGWALLTAATLVLAVPLVVWDLESLPEDRMHAVSRAWMALVVAWGIPTLLLTVRLWSQRERLKVLARERSGEQRPPRHARGIQASNDTAQPNQQFGLDDGQNGPPLGRADDGEPGPQQPASPLLVYRRGRRQLTIWPDGTLEEKSTRQTRSVSLVEAEKVSVDYEGEPVIVGRDKAFAPRTVFSVRDRSGTKIRVWVRWGMPQRVIAQFQQIAGGFGATIVDPLPPPLAPTPGAHPSWRNRLAEVSTWVSGLAAFIGVLIFSEVIAGSGVESDETDPRLWAAVLVCGCLTATALLALLDPPVSLGRLGLGLFGIIAAGFIVLHWGSLTGTEDDSLTPGLVYRPLSPKEQARVAADASQVGEPVREGDFRLVVTKIACSDDHQLGANSAPQGEQRCRASVTFTNLADHEVGIFAVDSLLFDNHGQPSMPTDTPPLASISPQQTLSTNFGYEIPQDATPALIMFEEADGKSRRVVINVGPS